MKPLVLVLLCTNVLVLGCKKKAIKEPTLVIYKITASAGPHGTLAPSGEFEVASGQPCTYTITPDSGYAIATLTVDGSAAGLTGTYTFNNVIANHTISATFAKAFTITASAGPNGRVSPLTQPVITGTNTVVAFIPNDGFHADSVWLDGTFIKVLDGETSYALTNVTANHTLKVSFSDLLTKGQADSLNNLLIGKWTMTSLNSTLVGAHDSFLQWDIQDIHSYCSSNVYSEYQANGVYVPNANLDATSCSPLGGQLGTFPQQFQISKPNHWQLRKNGKVIYMLDSPIDSLTNVTLTKDSLIAIYYGGFNGVHRVAYRYHYARKQ